MKTRKYFYSNYAISFVWLNRDELDIDTTFSINFKHDFAFRLNENTALYDVYYAVVC